MLEHRLQQARIRSLEHTHITPRDLGSGDIAHAMEPEDAALERHQPGIVGRPQVTTWMQQVDVPERPQG